jgi:hypothetical protein
MTDTTYSKQGRDYAKDLAQAALEEGMFGFRDMCDFLKHRDNSFVRALDKYAIFPSFKGHHKETILGGLLNLVGRPSNYGAIAAIDGIDHAQALSDELGVPFVNLKSPISRTILGKEVLYVTDYIGKGKYTAKQIHNLREAGIRCNQALAVFDWELPSSEAFLRGKRSFAFLKFLNPPCNKGAILNPDLILEVIQERELLTESQRRELQRLDGA